MSNLAKLVKYITDYTANNMGLLSLEISANRLLLQPISLKYKEDIFREFTEEITTYLYARPPQVISETELFIDESLLKMQRGENLTVVILKKDSQEFLGCSGILDIKSKHPKIGIWLKKSAHGNGYGLEAITALKEWADKNLDYEYLIYPVDRVNMPSKKIPEKLGGQIFLEFEHPKLNGQTLNIVEYRIPKK
ncbi:acetyltransferase, ribosomal protein N-acetylase [Cylindrospermum stagnale PCC 7417]|uniref:Acetyltransferase, ribosomal protein N-acetylase n=1 Tax=Cylindrospermum stagnale PCC 7417 TaxID=56107 RepID=K9WU36_9NOST|nr:GNAT family N-acetyltransferase [Cylindrospermum stagnale]AFZ23291.1 acetyltransferase, ribosomal protein N-acetylase [Cylindrospermum stagnale PCC 7417]